MHDPIKDREGDAWNLKSIMKNKSIDNNYLSADYGVTGGGSLGSLGLS